MSLTTEKTSTVGDHVYLADYDDQKLIRHVGSHLECFLAGNWLLGISLVITSNSGLKPIYQAVNSRITIPSSIMPCN
jgi:hypothetical protein